MIFNLFKRYHYFITIEISSTAGNKTSLNPKVLDFIKHYFFWRGYKIDYFEPMTSPSNLKTYIVVGTAKQTKTINRNALIFLLELYAHIKDPTIEISEDFPQEKMFVDGEEIIIYKIKK